MASDIVLASGSTFRQKLLQNAGVAFRALPSSVDERAVEAALGGSDVTPEDVALVLAEAKAGDVGGGAPEAWVIGCDQTLSLGDRLFHKPADMDEARRNLLALSATTHQLNSAVVVARGGETVWRHVSVAHMAMRDLSPAFVGRYLSAAGDAALSSVGAYQVEGVGLQLFDRIEGDYFAIVGLPMLPLLAALRKFGAIDG